MDDALLKQLSHDQLMALIVCAALLLALLLWAAAWIITDRVEKAHELAKLSHEREMAAARWERPDEDEAEDEAEEDDNGDTPRVVRHEGTVTVRVVHEWASYSSVPVPGPAANGKGPDLVDEMLRGG